MESLNRREFLQRSTALAAGVALFDPASRLAVAWPPAPRFRISLAEYSLHRALGAGELDHLDFAPVARSRFGIDAVEMINHFWKDRARDAAYLRDLKRRADDAGVRVLLIMCSYEGRLGAADEAERHRAIDNHRRWIEAARYLGGHAIRVNAAGDGTPDELSARVADSLRRLCEYSDPLGIDIVVENHGGLSSNGAWLASTIRAANHRRAGTLPDFGNWRVSPDGVEPREVYDRYRGVQELMPFARGVSAKSYDFDAQGNETTIDYRRMMRIVLDAGYRGHVGIEYEGKRLSEDEGIRATKRLLERLRDELSAPPA